MKLKKRGKPGTLGGCVKLPDDPAAKQDILELVAIMRQELGIPIGVGRTLVLAARESLANRKHKETTDGNAN